MTVDVYGAMRDDDGIGCVVRTVYEGGRTRGLMLEESVGCENEDLGSGCNDVCGVEGNASGDSSTGALEPSTSKAVTPLQCWASLLSLSLVC